MLVSTSRALLVPCLCATQRALSTSAPRNLRKSWFMVRDAKRRQEADLALDERFSGPSEFADVDPYTVDIAQVDKATARPSRDPAKYKPWYLEEGEELDKVDDKPWYVEAQYEGIPDGPGKEVDLAPEPPPPAPAHLPPSLRPLYDQLVSSLWVDPYTTTWIDAHASSDDGAAHTDWIIVCTVNAKRERAMAGSLSELKQWVRDAVAALYPVETGLKPAVSVEGYQRRYPDWMLFDGGSVMLHLFSPAARETWVIEDNYLKGAKARSVDASRGVPHPFFSTQNRGPASSAEIEGL